MITNFKLYENFDNLKINRYVDLTFIDNKSNLDKIKKFVNDSIEYNPYSICVLPKDISFLKNYLKDFPSIKLTTIIDFPKGELNIEKKINKINDVIKDQIDEIDVVINWKNIKKLDLLQHKYENGNEFLEKLLSMDINPDLDIATNDEELKIIKLYREIYNELSSLESVCSKNGIILKIIIESGELTLEQCRIITLISNKIGINYIQTSTGFAPNGKGAELEKVKIINTFRNDFLKIKAAGGIRNKETALLFIQNGADRIGTSVKI